MEIKTKPKVFHYETRVDWKGEKRGRMAAEAKPEVEVASPPEFRGHPGIWTPEELLVSAVNTCTMMTFLTYADRKEIRLRSYECDARGTLEKQDGKFRFTRIVLRPRITVAREEDRDRVVEIFRQAENNCLVTNSLTTRVEGEPEITVQS